MALDRTDVTCAFRYILGRAPENEETIEYHATNFASLDALRQHLIGTEEFRNLYSLLTDYTRDQTFDFSRRRAAFIHIPKTGGTTLTEALSAAIDPARIFPDRFKISRYPAVYLAQFDLFMGHFDLNDVRYIPGEVYKFTVIREPRARILSQYYYHQSRRLDDTPLSGDVLLQKSHLPLHDYLSDPAVRAHPSVDNAECRALFSPERPCEMTREVICGTAIANLLALDAVGTTDRLDAFLPVLAKDLRLAIAPLPARRMVTGHLHEEFPGIYSRVDPAAPDAETNRLLDGLVELDEPLYEAARRLCEHKLRDAPQAPSVRPAAD